MDNEVTKSVDKKVVEKLDDVYFFIKWIKPTFSQGLVLEMILHLKSFVSIKVFSIFYIEVLPLELVIFVEKILNCAFLSALLMNLFQRMHSHIGCICLTFLRCEFSNVSSNDLPQRMHSYTGCICLTFLQSVFSSVP